MNLVEKVRSLGRDEDESTYRYECQKCGIEFESRAPNPNDVNYPICRNGRVYTAI